MRVKEASKKPMDNQYDNIHTTQVAGGKGFSNVTSTIITTDVETSNLSAHKLKFIGQKIEQWQAYMKDVRL